MGSWVVRFTICALLSISGCRDAAVADPSATSTDAASTDATSTDTTDAATSSSSLGVDTSSSGPQQCVDPAPAGDADVVLPTATGDIWGTWSSPAGCPPFPTVLFHVGSGPTDRDGNTVGSAGRNDGHLQLARFLQENGVASVRFDKRGIAASAAALGDPEDFVIEMYIDDLLAWIDLLRAQEVVGPLTLLGHSEGSLIATIAARTAAVDALILAAGPGRPLADVLRTQLEQNLPDPELLARANEIITELEMGNTVDDVPPELLFLFAPQTQPYLISLFARDPAEELAGVTAPTAIIAGTADVQVPVSEAEILLAAKPDAELRIIENMTHVFKDAGQGQDAAYNDPTVPFAAGFTDTVLELVATAP